MATKRSPLPPITPEDIELHPDRLRETPNSGYAWKCHYCNEFASSETQRGFYVCRRHGGVTPKQRRNLGRPPGRPMTSGKHSRSRMLSVDEIVEEYRQNLIDADATDEDILYLRGYLARAIDERPSEEEVALAIEELIRDTQEFQGALNGPITQEALLRALAEIRLYRRTLKHVSSFYQRFIRVTAEIEDRYARFIKLARLRSTISHKNAPADQLAFFAVTVQHCLQVLSDRVPPEKVALLRARLEKDFEELPERALTLTALKPITLSTGQENSFYRSHQLDDRLDEIVSSLRSQSLDLDDTDEDMLRLRAHLHSLRQLVELISKAATIIDSALGELDAFMDEEEVEVAVRQRGEWEKVERLHAELSRVKGGFFLDTSGGFVLYAFGGL